MQNLKSKLSVFLILTNLFTVFSQNNTSSIYSFYGIGDIDRSGFASNRAMGGLGICLRDPNQINYLNPASYSAQDTSSFVFEIGMYGNFVNSITSTSQLTRNNFNINYIAFSFPVTKNYYSSVGLIPFSSVGYNLRDVAYTSNNDTLSYSYTGSGGLYQLYYGNSIKLLGDRLSLGVNISYIFGRLNAIDTITFPTDYANTYSTLTYNENFIRGFYINTGLQFKQKIYDKFSILLGLIYDPKISLRSRNTIQIIQNYLSSSSLNDTLRNNKTYGNVTLPQKIGVGLSFNYDNKLFLGMDYSYQDWSKASFDGQNESLKACNNISIGMEYTPNRRSIRSYFAKVKYRIGTYFNNTSLVINNTQINDYGYSFGIGLPFKNTNSVFNISFEHGIRGTTQNQLIQENYNRITFSLSLYDMWFFKKRYD
jgi:hypothetical protein